MTEKSIEIVRAETQEQIAHVRTLTREFVAWLRERYRNRPEQIDTYYDSDRLERELADLPGDFAPPAGRLLLSLVDGRAAGCVGFKRLDDQSCDVKRMFVRPEYQGLGIGGSLMRTLIGEAVAQGYRTMKLDTGDLQPEAISFYRSLGFEETTAYYDVPEALDGTMVFMEIALRPAE